MYVQNGCKIICPITYTATLVLQLASPLTRTNAHVFKTMIKLCKNYLATIAPVAVAAARWKLISRRAEQMM